MTGIELFHLILFKLEKTLAQRVVFKVPRNIDEGTANQISVILSDMQLSNHSRLAHNSHA